MRISGRRGRGDKGHALGAGQRRENRGAGLDQSARFFLTLAERLRHWTTGRVSQYVSMMVTGFTLILCGLTAAWWYFQI